MIEKKVADAVLERPLGKINISGKEFIISRPTIGTMILLSELVADLPDIRITEENVLQQVLSKARDCKVLGDIAAVLILGKKRIEEDRYMYVDFIKTERKFSWKEFRYIYKSVEAKRYVSESQYIAEKILEDFTPEELYKVLSERIGAMQFADFFAITTSLNERNILKTTKEEVATQFGE